MPTAIDSARDRWSKLDTNVNDRLKDPNFNADNTRKELVDHFGQGTNTKARNITADWDKIDSALGALTVDAFQNGKKEAKDVQKEVKEKFFDQLDDKYSDQVKNVVEGYFKRHGGDEKLDAMAKHYEDLLGA
jgi:uncharacterized membrane-anchored protein YhcB (DUF1043 family)